MFSIAKGKLTIYDQHLFNPIYKNEQFLKSLSKLLHNTEVSLDVIVKESKITQELQNIFELYEDKVDVRLADEEFVATLANISQFEIVSLTFVDSSYKVSLYDDPDNSSFLSQCCFNDEKYTNNFRSFVYSRFDELECVDFNVSKSPTIEELLEKFYPNSEGYYLLSLNDVLKIVETSQGVK
jgi:hypothetical protein